MVQVNKQYSALFSYIAIFVILLYLPCSTTFFSTRIYLYSLNVVSVILFLILKNQCLDKYGWIYLGCMLLGYFFHRNMKLVFESHLYELFSWCNILCLGYALNRKIYNIKKFFFLFMIFFYIAECSICIYEKLSHVYVFNYVTEFQATEGLASDYTSGEFRAHGLLSHPLYNANVISIFMAYLLCAKHLVKKQQIALLCLGAMALWACNSRASMVVWLLIFVYRFFLYKKNIIVIISTTIVAYIILPPLIDYVLSMGFLGRLSSSYDNEFSSLSRMIAFEVFADQKWTWERIVLGGDIVYYSNTNVGLENGILLNLSYWGWIIGSLKTLLELVITWLFIKRYESGEKLIILLAVWGVAFMNSNSFQSFPFLFFLMCNAAFAYITKNNIKNENKNIVCSRV